MKANKASMVAVALAKMSAEVPTAFPVFLYLEKGNRMVPVRLAGDPLGALLFQRLKAEGHVELWVPQEFLSALTAAGLAPPTGEKSLADAASGTGDLAAPKRGLAGGKDPEVAPETSVAPAQAAGLLAELLSISDPDPRARAEIARRMLDLASPVLERASAGDPLFGTVLALRTLEDPTDHGVFSGSLGAMLALDAGGPDDNWIAELLAAATFHDIGITQLGFDFGAKSRAAWTTSEWDEYRSHVERGLGLLRQCDPPLPPAVLRMIEEHHERADGTGYPRGLARAKLHRGSLLLALADRVDRQLWGEEMGRPASPAEALAGVRDEAKSLLADL